MKSMIEFSEAQTERFWASVAVRGEDECWEWQRACGKHKDNRYGRFETYLPPVNGKKRTNYWVASRVAYYLAIGEDPGKWIVCHHCNNPPCCNPAHLFLGTDKTNAQHREECGHGGRRGPGKNSLGVKLTDAQVRAMRKDIARATRDHMREYAREYGMTVSNIAAIAHRTSWLHL